MTPAHQTDGLAELVCSNSFRSDDAERNAVGLLHQEMRDARLADPARRPTSTRCPAGSALAVDRDGFSAGVTARDRGPPAHRARARAGRRAARDGPTIVATGPLTAPALADSDRRRDRRGRARLLRRDRPDRPPRQHRHGRRLVPVALGQGRGGKDYINCPMTKDAVSRLPRRACSTARRPSSRNGRTSPISTAACRSR